MSTNTDNMTDEELVKLRKDLSDKNWEAIGQFINGMMKELSEVKQQILQRDKVFADQEQRLQDLQRQVQSLTIMGSGNGPTQ